MLIQTDSNRESMELRAIATVKNEVRETGKREDWDRIVSEIVFNPAFEDALDGLKEFSHVIVLFWMHRSSAGECPVTKTHPQMRKDLPLVGVFATRSPVRPNPLGMTVVRLVKRRRNILEVTGLDAIDGTPVIDIKPYLPSDLISQASVPDWVHKLHRST